MSLISLTASKVYDERREEYDCTITSEAKSNRSDLRFEKEQVSPLIPWLSVLSLQTYQLKRLTPYKLQC